MCYESIRLGAWAIIGWTGVQFQALWTPRMTGMLGSYLTSPLTHTQTYTHTATSFPSARHFRLIGLATATAGWGLRHGQIQRVCISVCVLVCVVAKGLAGPSGTCRLNPIPTLLSWVDEQSLVLLWDPVLLPQRSVGLSWWVQQGSRGMLGATGGQLGVGMMAEGGSKQIWGYTSSQKHNNTMKQAATS